MAAFGKGEWNAPAPLWQHGPVPGQTYKFPGPSTHGNGGIQFTHSPMTTGTSVIGIQFKDGVAIVADNLGSYGKLARYRSIDRVFKINDNIIIGASGDYADFQYLKNIIDQKILEEECLDDGFTLKPKSLYCWLTRVMYNRRSGFDPLWNNFVIAGFDDGKPFVGTVDKIGTAYQDGIIATGFGAYLATPLLRHEMAKNPDMNKEEAIELLHKCLEVMFYRDTCAFPKYTVGVLTKEDGVEIRGPLSLQGNWQAAVLINKQEGNV